MMKMRLATRKRNDQQARQTKVSQRKRKKRIADDHSAGVEASAISSAATGDNEVRTGGAICQKRDSGEPFRTSKREELYFIEAKHFIKQPVKWTYVSDAFTGSEKYKPSVLVIATSNHFTNPCKDEISDWEKQHPHIHVIRWDRKQIEPLVLSKPSVKNLAVKFKLIPKSMQ